MCARLFLRQQIDLRRLRDRRRVHPDFERFLGLCASLLPASWFYLDSTPADSNASVQHFHVRNETHPGQFIVGCRFLRLGRRKADDMRPISE